jgi:hypothetical protein
MIAIQIAAMRGYRSFYVVRGAHLADDVGDKCEKDPEKENHNRQYSHV